MSTSKIYRSDLQTFVPQFLAYGFACKRILQPLHGRERSRGWTAGQRLYSRWDFRPFFESGAIDIAQPDVAHAGGISECRRIAAMAETYDVAFAPHCPIGPLALASCLHIGAATPNFFVQEMSLGIHYNSPSEDLTTLMINPDVFRVENGSVAVPEGPGLGVQINESVVREMARAPHRWRNPAWRGANGELREW